MLVRSRVMAFCAKPSDCAIAARAVIIDGVAHECLWSRPPVRLSRITHTQELENHRPRTGLDPTHPERRPNDRLGLSRRMPGIAEHGPDLLDGDLQLHAVDSRRPKASNTPTQTGDQGRRLDEPKSHGRTNALVATVCR